METIINNNRIRFQKRYSLSLQPRIKPIHSVILSLICSGPQWALHRVLSRLATLQAVTVSSLWWVRLRCKLFVCSKLTQASPLLITSVICDQLEPESIWMESSRNKRFSHLSTFKKTCTHLFSFERENAEQKRILNFWLTPRCTQWLELGQAKCQSREQRLNPGHPCGVNCHYCLPWCC